MNDVEKYGLFAVVFVGGVLLVIALQGGFSGGDPAAAAAPVVIGADVPLSAPSPPESRGQPPTRVRVRSIMPDTSFDWSEPPIAYPGERSSGHVAEPESTQKLAPAGAPVAISAPAGMHAVAAGETLSDIADRYLGDKNRWKELVALNPGLDPRKLKPGQQIRVASATGPAPGAAPADAAPATASAPTDPAPRTAAKAATPAAPKAATGNRTHTVVKGDTLGAIAKKYLGSTTRADDIWAANKDVLKSKDALSPGQVLRIP